MEDRESEGEVGVLEVVWEDGGKLWMGDAAEGCERREGVGGLGGMWEGGGKLRIGGDGVVGTRGTVLYEDSIDASDKLLLTSESSDLDEIEDVIELLSDVTELLSEE